MQGLILGMFIGAIAFAVAATVSRNRARQSAVHLGRRRESDASLLETGEDEGFRGDTDEIQALIKRGNKIEAIKVVRVMTGLDLKSSKHLVEKIERGEATEIPTGT